MFGKEKRKDDEEDTNGKDFLDSVVDDMGDDKGNTEYGADMEEDDGADEPETAKEDRLMAAGVLTKALGISTADRQKVADALEAFVKTCM